MPPFFPPSSAQPTIATPPEVYVRPRCCLRCAFDASTTVRVHGAVGEALVFAHRACRMPPRQSDREERAPWAARVTYLARHSPGHSSSHGSSTSPTIGDRVDRTRSNRLSSDVPAHQRGAPSYQRRAPPLPPLPADQKAGLGGGLLYLAGGPPPAAMRASIAVALAVISSTGTPVAMTDGRASTAAHHAPTRSSPSSAQSARGSTSASAGSSAQQRCTNGARFTSTPQATMSSRASAAQRSNEGGGCRGGRGRSGWEGAGNRGRDPHAAIRRR